MTRTAATPRPDNHLHLWLLAAGPLVWAAHFLLSYITAAVWCAKFAGRDGMLAPVHTAIGWYTAVALTAMAVVAVSGYRRHGRGTDIGEHHRDTPDDRHRFLGFAALLLAAFSAIATLYVALAAMFLKQCY
jgi:hypothetical protein